MTQAHNGKQKVKSSSAPARAIVEWPDGLNHEPIIYPAGGTGESDEAIRKALAAKLAHLLVAA